jgi:hypothetical protein
MKRCGGAGFPAYAWTAGGGCPPFLLDGFAVKRFHASFCTEGKERWYINNALIKIYHFLAGAVIGKKAPGTAGKNRRP